MNTATLSQPAPLAGAAHPSWCYSPECNVDSSCGDTAHTTDLNAGVERDLTSGEEIGAALFRLDDRTGPGPTVVEILYSHDGALIDEAVALTPEQARRYAMRILHLVAQAEGQQ
jgi:hypothetical protein